MRIFIIISTLFLIFVLGYEFYLHITSETGAPFEMHSFGELWVSLNKDSLTYVADHIDHNLWETVKIALEYKAIPTSGIATAIFYVLGFAFAGRRRKRIFK